MRIRISKSQVFFFDTVTHEQFIKCYVGRLTQKQAKETFIRRENPVNDVKVVYVKHYALIYEVDNDKLDNFLESSGVIVEGV